LTAAVP